MSEVLSMEAAPRERLRKVGITTGLVAFFFGALLVAMVPTRPTAASRSVSERARPGVAAGKRAWAAW